MIKTALISVSDKTWIVDFAKILREKWIKILSTWWTAKELNKNWIETIDVSDVTWFPEMMDWRVKTLHPKIHWWLLALRDNPEHMKIAEENSISMIDLVVVNLYPFVETISKEWIEESEAIEQVDIWWPSMLRSAAKNFQSITVITDVSDLKNIWKEIQENWNTSLKIRRELAIKVFETTSVYDNAICEYLSNWEKRWFFFDKKQDLRYWENPHQKAIFLKEKSDIGFNITNSRQLQWKELSYNNIVDADLAWSIVEEFSDIPAVSIIKHATPCWVAIWDSALDAYLKAYEVDKISPFGWIVAINRNVDKETAMELTKIFLEIVVAPSFDDDALEIFSKKKNLRILEFWWVKKELGQKIFKKVSWWLLIQDKNESSFLDNLKVVTKKSPMKSQIDDCRFAWKVIKYVKSNAIVIAKDWVALGVWAGQTNRVRSSTLALEQARETWVNLFWAVVASDAFFPFSDWIEVFENSWIECIVQPGGSIRDEEVIGTANNLQMSMVFCRERAFLH